MIFPVSSAPAPHLQRLTARATDSRALTPAVAPVFAAPTLRRNASRGGFPKASFSAQLLALGLHYGLDDLVNKADAESLPASADAATLRYARAQDNFMHDDRPALFARWSA